MLRFLPLPFRAAPTRRFRFLPLGLVALLFSALSAPAQDVSPVGDLIARPVSLVEGVVTGISADGKIVTLLGGTGNLDVDVSNARIYLAGREAAASPAAVTIGPGDWIVATIALPDAIPAIFPPPPLVATNVVVTKDRFTYLHGTIQGVDVAGSAFTMLFRIVHVDSNTEFQGGSAGGPIKSLADLAPGQIADVTVVASPLGLLAVRVAAHGYPIPPPIPFAFRGVVKAIAADQWTIDEKVVGITNETRIIGDPKVGDTVDVLAKIQNPPNPGMGMPSRIVAILITKAPVIGAADARLGPRLQLRGGGPVDSALRDPDRRLEDRREGCERDGPDGDPREPEGGRLRARRRDHRSRADRDRRAGRTCRSRSRSPRRGSRRQTTGS